MGCFQSNEKKKTHSIHFTQIKAGKMNQKWKQSLQINQLDFNIILNSNEIAEHPVFLQIQKDIKRTFPHQKHFQDQNHLQQFRQTLHCFALSFPKIGYTQGLNFLAGFLLLNKLTKIQSIRMMASVFINPSMLSIGLYEDNFPLTDLYCGLFWNILQKMDNQLYEWLKQVHIPDTMWIFQWYLTFYINSFPIEYIQYFLTYIFETKGFSLFKLSLGIVNALRTHILNLQKDEFCFVQFIDNLKLFTKCNKLLSIQNVIEKSQSVLDHHIDKALKEIKKSSEIENFYMKYFNANQLERRKLYELFIKEIQHENLEVSKSKDNTNLMQSYKRNSNNVQILDQILQQSIKRHQILALKKSKNYQSNMRPAQSKIFMKRSIKKTWKSEIFLDNNKIQPINQDQTDFSIVKYLDINNSKILLFIPYQVDDNDLSKPT